MPLVVRRLLHAVHYECPGWFLGKRALELGSQATEPLCSCTVTATFYSLIRVLDATPLRLPAIPRHQRHAVPHAVPFPPHAQGAGCGLSGIALAKTEIDAVVLSDHCVDALRNLQFNCRANLAGDRFAVRSLHWNAARGAAGGQFLRHAEDATSGTPLTP